MYGRRILEIFKAAATESKSDRRQDWMKDNDLRVHDDMNQ